MDESYVHGSDLRAGSCPHIQLATTVALVPQTLGVPWVQATNGTLPQSADATSRGVIMAQDGLHPAETLTHPANGSAVGISNRRTKVFVSYSRKDADFACELVAGLDLAGFEPSLDTYDIVGGEDWEARLGRLIGEADSVVFVISPDSVTSDHCSWEVGHTEELKKRLIPIVWRPVADEKVPPHLKRLNYIYFDRAHSFAPSLAALAIALRRDLDWVREHTRLLNRAQEWLAAGKPENRLLSGQAIAEAKAWLARSPDENLKPTELHRDFILASDHAESLRLSAERQRVEALQQAVTRTRVALFAVGALALMACLSFAGAIIAYRAERSTQRELADKLKEIERKGKELVELYEQAGRAARDNAHLKFEAIRAKHDTAEKPSDAVTEIVLTDADIAQRLGSEVGDFIIKYEVGSRAEYDNRYLRPSWFGGGSGVTIGIGYDIGYATAGDFSEDWRSLPEQDLRRLSVAVGVTGEPARVLARQLADITIPFDLAIGVFQDRDLMKYAKQTLKAFPKVAELPPSCFAALVSLVYNRGTSMKGERRAEMAAVSQLMVWGELDAVPDQIRAMKWIWARDLKMLHERREAEAALFEKGLKGLRARP